MAAGARRAACVGTLAIDYGDCGFVGLHDVFPHTESQENMRSHVLRVASVGGKLRVDTCGAQAEGRVDGVVVAVNEVVDYSRMVRALRENFFQDGCCAHVGSEVAAMFCGAWDGECVDRGGGNVIGISLMGLRHGPPY